MQIVCPSCHTAYSVNDASMGAGRKVRCARCKTVWMAMAVAEAQAGLPPAAPPDPPAPPPPPAAAPRAEADLDPAPHVASPPTAAGLEDDRLAEQAAAPAAPAPEAPPHQEAEAVAAPLTGRKKHKHRSVPDRLSGTAVSAFFRPRGAWLAALALLAADLALVGLRGTIVRLMPSAAPAYAAIGLPVNLRGIAFQKVTVATETLNGVSVATVSGLLQSQTPQPVEVPRLRFAVRDAAGHELYTWTSNLDRAVLAPFEAVPFRSIVAEWPAEAKDVTARFFTRADLTGRH